MLRLACVGVVAMLAGAACDRACAGEVVLHSFGRGTDGTGPGGALVDVGGVLYGTTLLGGVNNDGAIFAYNLATGVETVVHSFSGGSDGAGPSSGLVDIGGVLYGTTGQGGTATRCAVGCGTIYSFNPQTGAEAVLYSFGSSKADGDGPSGDLVNVGGVLYGTTRGLNIYTETVYSFNPATGIETVLHTFVHGSFNDGQLPNGGLAAVRNYLWGTTNSGGDYGLGTVFALDLSSGAYRVVYSFGSTAQDGTRPDSGFTLLDGTLYGNTADGGVYGLGTVFAVDPKSGAERVVYSFANGPIGYEPGTTLLAKGGTLFGTTLSGGDYKCTNSSFGCGAVFSLVPATGAATSLYVFLGQPNASFASSPLLDVGGKLYGTSSVGGDAHHPDGTLYMLAR